MKELLSKELEQLRCTGAGVAVTKGAEQRHFTFGKAHLDYDLDVTESSVFDIASISKLFTTTLVFKLVEENKISLDTPVIDVLNHLPTQWKGVTVRHLLTHSSGLPNYTSTALYWKETRLDVPKERILAYVSDMDLCFEPGLKWEYNNTGFYLLGLLLEALEQQSFFTVVQDKLFTPLGITVIYPTNHYTTIPHRVKGYSKGQKGFQPAEYYSHSGTYSAGGFSADLTSFLAFENALFAGKIISQNSLAQLLTPYAYRDKEGMRDLPFQMCHGLFLFRYRDKKVFAHAGSIMGFSSAYLRVYEEDVAMIIAVNTGDIDASVLTNILYKVYDVL
jgi:CubicO group peptidase (beta-lactamase class C family)